MEPSHIKYSAPGSLMLMGEHAVLRGQHAIVSSLNNRLSITLTPTNNQSIDVKTQLGSYLASTSELPHAPRFDYLIDIIKYYQPQLHTGFKMAIHSDIPHQYGLGSSAALCVCLHACLHHWLYQAPINLTKLQDLTIDTIHRLKQHGSGSDVIASIHGGTILVNPQHNVIQPLDHLPPLVVIYSGHKTPTHQVIKKVSKTFEKYPAVLPHIDRCINELTKRSADCINQQNWSDLGELFNMQQGLMETLMLTTAAIRSIHATLTQHPHISGAKISGSGLGDCVIGTTLTHSTPPIFTFPLPIMPLAINLHHQGLRFET